jgi:hypothetical protein
MVTPESRNRPDGDALRRVASMLRWSAYALAVAGLYLVFVQDNFLVGCVLIVVAVSDGIAVVILNRRADLASASVQRRPET